MAMTTRQSFRRASASAAAATRLASSRVRTGLAHHDYLPQSREDLVAYASTLPTPGIFHVFGRVRGAGFCPGGVVIDQRFGLVVINIEPFDDGVFDIIGALHQLLAGYVVFARHFGGLNTT